MQFVAQFEPQVREGMATKFVFDVTANATNVGESDDSKVQKQASVDVQVSCKLDLKGYSKNICKKRKYVSFFQNV